MSGPYDTNTTADELVSDYSSIIKDKVILTTGVSPGGLGAFFVQSIAKAQPAQLILATRNVDKLAQTAADITAAQPAIKVRTLNLDLGSQESVRAAAAEVNAWDDIPAIDVLVNNAGIMAVGYKLSPEGTESQFATNHLGHFLFTNLIMKKIVAAKEPRIVSVSSDGHRLGGVRFSDFNFDGGKTYNRWLAYGQAKTANMLFAISLAEKLGSKHRVQAYSLHPGVIFTNLADHLDFKEDFAELGAIDRAQGNFEGWAEGFNVKPIERGAATHVYAAFDPNLKANNGAYLIDCRLGDPWVDNIKAWATSSFEAGRLWKLSEKLVGQEFAY